MNVNITLIINPGRYPHFARKLKKLMRLVDRCTIQESTSPEHFTQLMKDFIAGEDSYLLVWGGDGTANLTLNCLMKYAEKKRRKEISIGFLRGGSGNGTQDSYEVPWDLKKQVKAYMYSIEHALTQKVDILKVEFDEQVLYGQLFGSGMDARILGVRNGIRRVASDKAPRTGLIPYLLSSISIVWEEAHMKREPRIISMKRGKFAFRGTRTNAEFPFSEYDMKSTAPLIEVGVRPYYGWRYKICPDVVCNDGFMDAYLFNIKSRMLIILNLFHFWTGKYYTINARNARRHLPLIEHFKVKECTLSPSDNHLFHIDGELHSTDGPVSLSVKPRALKFLVPDSFYEKFHPIHEWDKRKK